MNPRRLHSATISSRVTSGVVLLASGIGAPRLVDCLGARARGAPAWCAVFGWRAARAPAQPGHPLILAFTVVLRLAPFQPPKLALNRGGRALQRLTPVESRPPLPPRKVSLKLEIGMSGRFVNAFP